MNILATCHTTSRGLSYTVVYEVKVEWSAEWHPSVGFCPSLGVRLRVTDVVQNLSQIVPIFIFISCTLVVSDMKCEFSESSYQRCGRGNSWNWESFVSALYLLCICCAASDVFAFHLLITKDKTVDCTLFIEWGKQAVCVRSGVWCLVFDVFNRRKINIWIQFATFPLLRLLALDRNRGAAGVYGISF